jgi:chromosome segregation ATPase
LAPEQIQPVPTDDVLLWLEDELREAKVQVARLEQGLSEARGQITALTSLVHAAEDGTTATSARLAEIPQVAGQVGQVRQTLVQLEEQAGAVDRRLTEALRLQQLESERLRQDVNATHRRVELVERLVETWSPRFEHLEDADRRLHEAITLTRQRTEELERRQESAELRTSRGLEAMQRYDHEIGRLAVDVQAFQKREALTGERLQAFGESVRRAERQTEAIATEVAEQREFSEKLELLRAEIHRVEDRISAFETSTDSNQQELADHRRSLGLLDGKDRGFSDRLALIQTELAAYREQVADQFHRLHIALDRHRRRQIEELERDLRDLKVTAFRPPDEETTN